MRASGPRSRAPLILFLHGAGERGTSVGDIVRQGLPRLLSGAAELTAAERTLADQIAERAVVVAPQCPPLEVWDEPRLLALLDRVSNELNTDPARVYLTGLSMGGFGVWSLGLRHPERYAALVPICGGGRIADVVAAVERCPAALRSLGVWAFHGARDKVVPLEESERMVTALRGAGVSDIAFTVYPELEHDAWTAGYATAELYPWLFAHAR